ncbi:MAG: hypothetical protein RL637_1635 [Pseudomonadota bacterium]|jgi:LEA14-like dessication related protein
MTQFIKLFTLLLGLLLLNGCANNTNSAFSALMPVAPEIRLKSFQLVKMGLTQQTYHLQLQIKNPNAFPLPVQSLNYQLFLNNKSFFNGTNTQAVNIPALGESIVETDINSNIAEVISGWQQWLSLAKRNLNYRLVGNVGISSYAIPIQFQYADKIDLALTQ